MVAFRYADFYDVPRLIFFDHLHAHYLLQSLFNDEKDDYEENYSVYAVPVEIATKLAAGHWKSIEEARLEKLGEIPVGSVVFDTTKRRLLDPSFLGQLLQR